MPNGKPENPAYDPNIIYSVPPEEDFIGPQLPGQIEYSDNWNDEITNSEIIGAGFSGLTEAKDQFKDFLDDLTGGLTKVYKQLYYLAGFGLIVWGYSIFKK